MRLMRPLSCLLLVLYSMMALADPAVPRGRLPTEVVPTGYDLELWMDPRADRFSGTVAITLDVRTPTRSFWLHARDSTLGEVHFEQSDDTIGARAERVLDEAGLVRIDLAALPARGPARLRIAFDAPYNLKLEGAYKVHYANEPYVMTQMEPLGARNAFPCFDEPAFKTPWRIAIVAPRQDQAIANTREIALEKVKDGWARHVFAETKPLPSYLIAFAVGPWDVVAADPIPATALRADPIPLRGIAARGQGQRMQYMLGETAGIVHALEAYFDSPYPYDKLDLLAAPDFAYGAMENAGLITYRDALMFASPEQATSLRRRAIGTHVHELGHQWFGNLVTMPWWDDLWLNEAFATWVVGRITPELYPDLQSDLNRVSGGIGAMDEDSLASSRRVRTPIDDYTDVGSAFDGITYQKGGAMLAMFERYMGRDAFRAALRAHMKRFAHGNATAPDLADSMAAQATDGTALRRAFASFTDQPGVPLLDIRLDCTGERAALDIRQSRYRPIGGTFDPAANWVLPFCARVGSQDGHEVACTLLDGTESRFELPSGSCPRWIHPNADAAGYYRFRIDESLTRKLVKARAQLNEAELLALADSFSAALGDGSARSRDYPDRVTMFAEAGFSDVVTAPIGDLWFLKQRVADARGSRRIDALLRKHWGKRLRRIGIDPVPGEPEETVILRNELIDALLSDGRPQWLVDRMAERGRRVLGQEGAAFDATAVSADQLRPALYAAVLVDGTKALARVRAHLQTVEDSIHRGALIGAMSAAESPEAFEAALAFALDPKFRSGELARVMWSLTTEPRNHAAFWDWLQANDATLMQLVPAVFQGRLSSVASGVHCSEAGAKAIEAFYGDRVANLESGPRALAQALESVRLCAARRASWSRSW